MVNLPHELLLIVVLDVGRLLVRIGEQLLLLSLGLVDDDLDATFHSVGDLLRSTTRVLVDLSVR